MKSCARPSKPTKSASSLASSGGLSFREALRFELNPKSFLDLPDNDSSVVITNGQWMESVMARMLHPEAIAPVQMETSFKAKLRPYQQRGVAWLSFLHSLRFGMCLADDMGLGKTVQVLAMLREFEIEWRKRGQPACGSCIFAL